MRYLSKVRTTVIIDLDSKIKAGKCPICGKTGVKKYRPFCSRRCADLDLAKWLNGNYTVPTDELTEGDLDELETALRVNMDSNESN